MKEMKLRDLCFVRRRDEVDTLDTGKVATEPTDGAKSCKRCKVSGKPQFFRCGCCDQYHPKGWTGDCRDDRHRFNADDLDAAFGSLSWEEVDELTDEEGSTTEV